MDRLKTNIAGLSLKNPLMNASGFLGLTACSLKRLAEAGLGAVVTKSIGLEARDGNPNPTIVETPCGLLNSMGLPNPGVNEMVQELKRTLKLLKVPLIVSIYGFNPDEYFEVSKRLDELEISAFEVNVSCPHVEKVGEIGQKVDTVVEVVRKVKSATKKPVFVKLSPNVSNIVEIAKAAVNAGADAITAINTVKAMVIDIETGKPVLSGKFGGLSGPAMKPIAIRCVYEIYREVDVPIIGCGGVTSWEDVVEFFMAGASAVQVGTAILHEDLNVFKRIIQGLERYLKRKNLKHVGELTGLAHKNFR